MAGSRTVWLASLLAWMEALGTSFDWVVPAHWGC
jgi:hypothetical protein